MKLKLQAVLLSCFFANGMSTSIAAPSIPSELLQDSLVYCTAVSGFSFNPQKADMSTNMNVVTEQIYDRLIEFDADTNSFKPALAERFEVSEDGLEFTFYLRKNVEFHQTRWFTPTRFFNAEDVLFSINRVLGKETADLPELEKAEQQMAQNALMGELAKRAHFPYFESIDVKSRVESVSAPSEYVVKIRLTRPDASFLGHLASQFAAILSKEYALQLNADENISQLDLYPIGTGVYQLERYEQNEYVRLMAHPNYWGEKAKTNHIIVDFSTTATGRMAKFLNGECDISAFLEPSQLQKLNDEKGYLIDRQGANLAYLAFNFDRPIGQDKELRRYISRSINRERLAQQLFYGTADVANTVLPKALSSAGSPSSYPYFPPIENMPKRLEKPLVLWVLDEKQIYNLHPLKMAEMIRYDLVKAGIDVEVKAVSRAYLTQRMEEENTDYDMILSGWLANNLEADSFLSPILACQAKNSVTNIANWCNQDFDNLLFSARLAENNEQRQNYYRQAQQFLETELPIFPLMNVRRVLVVNNDVENVKVSPFGQTKLSEMRLK